jgi:hypothetical protein
LIGQQIRLHCVRRLDDRRRGIGHFNGKLVDFLGIVDQFGQSLLILFKLPGGFLDGLCNFCVGRRNRLQRGLDEFETPHRAGRNRLVGIDDEGIGERACGLKLRSHLLRSERDGRKLGIVLDTARQVVELVTQHIAAAHELVLGQKLGVVLYLHDIGKDLGEGAEFAGQARDLIDARRIRRAPHRFFDGLFQAGFGRQCSLGVVFFPGHRIISCQRTVFDQFAVDLLGRFGFRYAVAVRHHARGNALESHIGHAHADRRDGEYEHKTEHDFAAESQGREL